MKIAIWVLLIAVTWRPAAPVFADHRYPQMRGHRDVASQYPSRRYGASFRYDDAAFSLSYRYYNSAFGLHPRQRYQGRGRYPPQWALGPRHRHHDSGYGLHKRHRQRDSGFGLHKRQRQHDVAYRQHKRQRKQGDGVAAGHGFAGFGRYQRSDQYRYPLRSRRD